MPLSVVEQAATDQRSQLHFFITCIAISLLLSPWKAIALLEFQSLPHLRRSSILDIGQEAPLDFCTQSFSRKSCPVPPTYDSIVIEKYLGKWYEIGSTARTKLQNEAGLACYQANYSLADADRHPQQGAKIAIVHRGFPKVGPVSRLGVTRLSSAANGVCENTRHICKYVGPDSPLRDALYDISRVVVEISPTHANQASILSQAIVNISSFLQNIGSGLSCLAANVTMIQITNGKVSQAIGTKQTNLESLNKLIRGAMSQQSALTQLVSNIGEVQDAIIEVAKSLIVEENYAEAAAKLLQAGQSIDKQAKRMMEKLTKAELELIAMGAASSSMMVDKAKPDDEWAIVKGQAVQNYSSPAKLVVSMQGFSGPYWIIGLEGSAEKGYGAALVYSCMQDQKGEMQEALYVLSRVSELPRDSIDRFLASAKLFGISTSCQNPFLLTLQDCGSSQGDLKSYF